MSGRLGVGKPEEILVLPSSIDQHHIQNKELNH